MICHSQNEREAQKRKDSAHGCAAFLVKKQIEVTDQLVVSELAYSHTNVAIAFFACRRVSATCKT